MPTSQTDWKVALGTTANATPTAILSFAAPDGMAIYVEALVIVRNAAGASKVFKVGALFNRVAGTLSLVGAVQNLMTSQGDSALSATVATLAVSGTNIVVNATGIAATTLNWRARCDYEIYAA